jgi:hypothetical protein
MRKYSALLLLLLLGLSECGRGAPATKPATVPVDGPAGAVSFLAMGDWGMGNDGQRRVAETLAAYAQKVGNVQAVVLAGDNFYMKVADVKDPVWKHIFEDMYDIKRLNVPFFACLGNHDYLDNKAQVELDYAKFNPGSRWKMPARWYRVDIPSDKPVVTLLMLESTKDKMSAADWAAQMAWMDEQLSKVPAGVWTVAAAHHPLFSNGGHGDNGVMQTNWGPIFLKRHLDFYLCGHDHDLQHLEIPGQTESFVLVGGGGAGTRQMVKDTRGPFSKSINGFGHFQFTPEKATVRYISAAGETVHVFERTKAGEVKVLANTPSDTASTKPLKEIQGIGKPKNDD